MATVQPVISYPINGALSGQRQAMQIVWGPLASGDDGAAVELPVHYQDRTVQIAATFGDGTVTVQGSNDGANFVTLKDINGTAISKTAAALEQIGVNSRHVKPAFSGTTGTGCTVTLLVKRAL